MLLKIIRAIAVIPVVALLCGAQCSFVATSGGSHDDGKQDRNSGLVVVIRDGTVTGASVEGLRFEAGSLTGFTGTNGEFQFEDGASVAFFIGDLAFGSPVPGNSLVALPDLVPGGEVDSPEVVNMARLLQSLDSDPGDDRITIPPRLHNLAVRSNAAVSAPIAFLDFGDEAVFANSASQLVATLTRDYAFTAVLVDAETARRSLRDSLRAGGP
jgi:hypothetical protein